MEEYGAIHRSSKYRMWINPLEAFDDGEFKGVYRFNKQTIRYILNMIKDDLLIQDKRRSQISPEVQLLTAIRYWGHSEEQNNSAAIHGVSQRTVYRICRKVAIAIASRSMQFIKMPTNAANEQTVIEKFAEISGFPNIVGAIDCRYIKIREILDKKRELNVYKHGYSFLNIQIVCDARLQISNIVPRWADCIHDAVVFNQSNLKERFSNGEFNGRLLGDSEYAFHNYPYLLTPISTPQNDIDEVYNASHAKTWSVVGSCLDLWKKRFPCLENGMNCMLDSAQATIEALAVLHNIAILSDDYV